MEGGKVEVISFDERRELEIIERRIAGESARKVGRRFNLSPEAVNEIVLRRLPSIDVQAEARLLLERLALIETCFFEKAQAGDMRAVELLLLVLEFKMKMLSAFKLSDQPPLA